MGKGCVRSEKLEDLALDVVGRTVAAARCPRRSPGQRSERAPYASENLNSGNSSSRISEVVREWQSATRAPGSPWR